MARTKDFDEKEVLTKAMELFWSRGYNATSMEDLVGGLGISRSSLYDTYTDKHSLFIKALEQYQQMGMMKIREIVSSPGTAKETVRKLIEQATMGSTDARKRTGCFMVNAEVEVAQHDKKVNSLVCSHDKQLEEIFYEVIQKGKKSGEIKNRQDSRILAKFFSNTIKGMLVTAKSTADKSVFSDIIALTVSILDQDS